MNRECIFSLFNGLYRWCFPLYRVLYFSYKRVSDRDKIGLITGHVKPGMTVLDIGANIGFYTTLLSRCVGKNGTVYAFEPEEANFYHLKRLTKKLTNIKRVKAACGEKSGVAALYKSEDLYVDHHLYKNDESRERIDVRMVSVDDYLKSECGGIGFAKIDVQGYDCFVVKGMKETLSRSDNTIIIGELWPYGLRQAGSSANEYLSELRRLGFIVEILSKDNPKDFSSHAEDRSFYCDFIARRPV
ncbi:MAG TPA: FkbM family methyltransferase [Syntrophus sp. (in: bacteria)]|nr:FkbM family methyltransferase [Syntrophus sp. (in: bacteria)]